MRGRKIDGDDDGGCGGDDDDDHESYPALNLQHQLIVKKLFIFLLHVKRLVEED